MKPRTYCNPTFQLNSDRSITVEGVEPYTFLQVPISMLKNEIACERFDACIHPYRLIEVDVEDKSNRNQVREFWIIP